MDEIQQNGDAVTRFEDKMREAERLIEEAGAGICSLANSGESFYAVNRAIESVRDAIHAAYKMRRGA